ncbi:unnamed protein product [Phytophthora lilii]|uniref:Unnamed protein product n=1 Tax=Phytophthora lilii TaxID=2077276 RepID=A0A9W6XGN4_9STRA|nr:unnamed protein product [Phytophthora lilii]
MSLSNLFTSRRLSCGSQESGSLASHLTRYLYFPEHSVSINSNDVSIMNDAMIGEDAPKKYTLSDDEIDEIRDQKRSKQAVVEIFDVYPVLADLRIHPVDANGCQLTKYYDGREAKTYIIRLKKVVLVPSISWSETYDYIGVILTNDVRFLTYINEKRERNEMAKEDKDTPR